MKRISLGLFLLIFLFQSFDVSSALPREFDSLGPTVQELVNEDGRSIYYIDDGDPNGIPVVFIGGLGTSVRAIRLLDFLRTMRRDLNIRIITVERNGFGQTNFNKNLSMTDYAIDVEKVLSQLGINRFTIFGISGGGPYAKNIAARNYQRIISLHMAATPASIEQGSSCNTKNNSNPHTDLLAYPMKYFGFPSSSAIHKIEGFQDTAFDEAARAHNLRGQAADPAPLNHEMKLYCLESPLKSVNIKSQLFVYRGEADQLLIEEPEDAWKNSFPNAQITFRRYPREGHDVQYRHLDQILLDIATQSTDVLVCENGNNILIAQSDAKKTLANGATLGLCLWKK